MTISKTTFLKDSFDTLLARLKDQITTVTTDASVIYTVQTHTSSFPDKEIDNKSAYPILLLEPLDINWEEFTFTKKTNVGTFTIDIYSTNIEASDLFLDAIITAIETYRDTLFGLGMYFVQLDSTDYDNVKRGGFKVHLRSCTFTFKYNFTKTRL